MVGDRTDAMLEIMDDDIHEARHEGNYRRIKLITGRRQRRNWTDEEKARILAESAEPDANISAVARRWGVNRGLLNVWRREAGLTGRRAGETSVQEPAFVPLTMVCDPASQRAAILDIASAGAGRIELEIAGARMTVIGSVVPELAQAMVAALRARR